MAVTCAVFIHIPKAAGTTLYSILDRQYHDGTVFTANWRNSAAAVTLLGSLPAAERARIRCVRGHIPVGVHEHLPQPCVYITLMRDPVDRVVSHYRYVRRTPQNYLHDWVVNDHISFDEYVAYGPDEELNNGQTRMLAGTAFYHKGGCSEMLEAAKRNLRERFAVVGTSDRFDESLLLMKKRLGWRLPYYARQNVSPPSARRIEVTPQALRAIRLRNQLDIELYAHAEGLLQTALQEAGPVFRLQLVGFCALNRVAGAVRGPARMWRQRVRRAVGRVRRRIGYRAPVR